MQKYRPTCTNFLFGLLSIFLSTVFISCNEFQTFNERTDKTITVYEGDTSTGKLRLSHDSIEGFQFKKIIWQIYPASNVASLEMVEKKPNSPWAFPIGNPKKDKGKLIGRIINAPKKTYEYYIKWIPKGSNLVKTYDPKISIKPSFEIFQNIVALLLGLLLFIPFFLFAKRLIKS